MKTADRAADLVDRMKKALVRTADGAQNLTDDGQLTPSEYAGDKLQYGMEDIATEAGHIVVGTGKSAYRTVKSATQNLREKRRVDAIQKKPRFKDLASRENISIRVLQKTEWLVQQSARSEKQSARTEERSVKGTQRTVKTAEQSSKVANKTAQETAKAAKKSTQATTKAAEKAVQITRVTAKVAAVAAKAAAKAVVAAVKAIIAGVKSLVAAISAGGWIAVVIIVVIMLAALTVGSCYGIFFSSEDTGSTMTMRGVVQEINEDYQSRIDSIRSTIAYDKMEAVGSRAVWPEVLAVYAVKVNSDAVNPQEVATIDDAKKATLEQIFWDMNDITYHTETKSETVIAEEVAEDGKIVAVETTQTLTTLYLTVSHKTAMDMANKYGFDANQKDWLAELLQSKNNSMWSAVLYGIHDSNEQIVAVANSQLGNVGGQPYWSWYGFSEHVEWCACFVSWCANECGYIDMGIVPKFAGCATGVWWFKNRGQWADNTATPTPGMIIFFDWNMLDGETGMQDGYPDHVGIVEKVEDGHVYTIEGNRGDWCVRRSYPVGYYEIFGYGIPEY